jgi:hypothetical protein
VVDLYCPLGHRDLCGGVNIQGEESLGKGDGTLGDDPAEGIPVVGVFCPGGLPMESAGVGSGECQQAIGQGNMDSPEGEPCPVRLVDSRAASSQALPELGRMEDR